MLSGYNGANLSGLNLRLEPDTTTESINRSCLSENLTPTMRGGNNGMGGYSLASLSSSLASQHGSIATLSTHEVGQYSSCSGPAKLLTMMSASTERPQSLESQLEPQHTRNEGLSLLGSPTLSSPNSGSRRRGYVPRDHPTFMAGSFCHSSFCRAWTALEDKT